MCVPARFTVIPLILSDINKTKQKRFLTWRNFAFFLQMFCYLVLLFSIVFLFILKGDLNINMFSPNGN